MTITEQQFYDMLDVDEHIESKFPDWIPLIEEKK